ncbi:DUF6059 family protein [Streptomyces sp. NPDC057694]|uniref:DUF6059 family protein n=1 Tax=Streptomyces sp. NPDC057694 TaxID=3346216 RepID=UPI0036A47E42
MRRWLRAGRALLTCRFLRSAWRSLKITGAVQTGPWMYHFVTSASTPEPGPLAPSAHFGPPPGHPERLRPDLPLTEEESSLDRELWPAHDGVRPPDEGP